MRMVKPSCTKWWSCVRASVRPRARIVCIEIQFVRL
jgi:hypothetical protein